LPTAQPTPVPSPAPTPLPTISLLPTPSPTPEDTVELTVSMQIYGDGVCNLVRSCLLFEEKEGIVLFEHLLVNNPLVFFLLNPSCFRIRHNFCIFHLNPLTPTLTSCLCSGSKQAKNYTEDIRQIVAAAMTPKGNSSGYGTDDITAISFTGCEGSRRRRLVERIVTVSMTFTTSLSQGNYLNADGIYDAMAVTLSEAKADIQVRTPTQKMRGFETRLFHDLRISLEVGCFGLF
jgi:hypothetical protein